MTREWTDENGRSWTVHAADPEVDGQPYLVEFVWGETVHRADYAGGRAPDDLRDMDLQALLNAIGAVDREDTSSIGSRPAPGEGAA